MVCVDQRTGEFEDPRAEEEGLTMCVLLARRGEHAGAEETQHGACAVEEVGQPVGAGGVAHQLCRSVFAACICETSLGGRRRGLTSKTPRRSVAQSTDGSRAVDSDSSLDWRERTERE